MYKGLRHTIQCTKCQETTKAFEDYDDAEKIVNTRKSECCGASFEYVGLRPYFESILKTPFTPSKIEIKQSEPDEDTPEIVEQETVVTHIEIPVIEEKKEETPIITECISIEDVITPGPKGVSNAQMIPALKQAINERSSIKVALLKKHYP
jgi:hypothetical protein